MTSDLDSLPQGRPPKRPSRRSSKGSGSGSGSGSGTPPRAKTTTGFRWGRFGKIVGLVSLILGVLLAGTGIAVWKYVSDKFEATHDKTIKTDPLPKAAPITEPLNILVLGSDARNVVEGSGADQRQFNTKGLEGKRSDTIMLIHIRRGGSSAVGLSFPRDLRVKIPGKSGMHKINAAYNGGANLVMETIRDLTNLPIHHYVEVNYSSFQRIVNAVGGVNLCVTKAYADAQSGLYVDKPGCYEFDGNKALSFVRMRKSDPEGDFGRIKRQQQFIRELMGKVKSIGFLLDVPKVLRLANAVSSGIVTDQNLSLGLIRSIANKLAGYSQQNIDFRTVPGDNRLINGASYVVMREEEATSLFEAIAADGELPDVGKTSASIPGPGDVQLDVRNASSVAGAGRAWRDKLEAAGFNVRKVENADKPRARTQIAFAPGADLKAKLLAEQFPDAELVQSVNLGSVVDCVVLIGEDVAAQALPSPSPS